MDCNVLNIINRMIVDARLSLDIFQETIFQLGQCAPEFDPYYWFFKKAVLWFTIFLSTSSWLYIVYLLFIKMFNCPLRRQLLNKRWHNRWCFTNQYIIYNKPYADLIKQFFSHSFTFLIFFFTFLCHSCITFLTFVFNVVFKDFSVPCQWWFCDVVSSNYLRYSRLMMPV